MKKSMGEGIGVCAACKGWLRLDGAMTTRDGQFYHQGCPEPKPKPIRPVAEYVAQQRRKAETKGHVITPRGKKIPIARPGIRPPRRRPS